MGVLQEVPAGNTESDSKKNQMIFKTSSVPFSQAVPAFASVSGPTYSTIQTLVQQVAYTLSDKLYTYSPETFGLDSAAAQWQEDNTQNAFGNASTVHRLETRQGAGTLALGYNFSSDFDLSSRQIPQSILASSASLAYLRPALEQTALLYNLASPLVAHVAAVDYAPGSASGLVTDYITSMSLAEDLDLNLLSSSSVYESQHMSLLATLLATSRPSIHTYDGITVGRETTRVVDVLDRNGLKNVYDAVIKATAASTQSRRHDPVRKTSEIFKSFNDELGTEYKPFEYHGHSAPEAVLVVFGTVEASLSAQVASFLSKGAKVGVVNVRLYRPFLEEAFFEVLPKSTRHIAVLGQVTDQNAIEDAGVHSALYFDVLGAATFAAAGDSSLDIVDLKYSRGQNLSLAKITEVFSSMAGYSKPVAQPQLLPAEVKQYSFWDVDDAAAATAPIILGQAFSSESRSNVTVQTTFNNLIQGGILRTDIRESNRSIEAAYPVHAADVAYVGSEKLLGEIDIIRNMKSEASIIVRLPGYTEESLEKRLPASFRKAIVAKDTAVFVLDPKGSSKIEEDPWLENLVIQLAFVKVAKGTVSDADLQKLASLNGSSELLRGLTTELDLTLKSVALNKEWSSLEEDSGNLLSPSNVQADSFLPFDKRFDEAQSYTKDWKAVAKSIAFKEAYDTKDALRPDLGVKTSIVHVKEHRRLTPLSYDRNIFHIEFDLGDSGVKYQIGEALGIHAENDHAEVEKFISWYGLNKDSVVEVPSRENPDILEARTVYQALVQNIDIFGRPPKKFYEALSEFASDTKEKQDLLTLSMPDGATEFKRRAEVDTITYADLLLEFKSARPAFNDIARIVAPMKRREYSIASSQRVQPNSVSLLIVTVNWVDPSGRDRFGQATRYLNALPIGAPVTVSVKPSVMKLPQSTKAPIIMAGLGTGLAPFRAFVQERALQKKEGHEIGAVMLYMGSRHQREEYLYGEEWEAYQAAGIITLLGRAFSRDQPKKVYIQDRMRQTMTDIRQAYLKEEGSFYLCGPTWPVPDVTEVLQEAYEIEERFKGVTDKKKIDGRRAIEQLKDDGRYVLEVY